MIRKTSAAAIALLPANQRADSARSPARVRARCVAGGGHVHNGGSRLGGGAMRSLRPHGLLGDHSARRCWRNMKSKRWERKMIRNAGVPCFTAAGQAVRGTVGEHNRAIKSKKRNTARKTDP